METEDLVFKREFLKLVEKHPCSMGYYFQDQIDEFEQNHRPKEKATYKGYGDHKAEVLITNTY